MDTHQFGLLNEMAFGILELLDHKTPSEEEVKLVEQFLSQFMIIPYPPYELAKHKIGRGQC